MGAEVPYRYRWLFRAIVLSVEKLSTAFQTEEGVYGLFIALSPVWGKVYPAELAREAEFPEDLRLAEDKVFNLRVFAARSDISLRLAQFIPDAAYVYNERTSGSATSRCGCETALCCAPMCSARSPPEESSENARSPLGEPWKSPFSDATRSVSVNVHRVGSESPASSCHQGAVT